MNEIELPLIYNENSILNNDNNNATPDNTAISFHLPIVFEVELKNKLKDNLRSLGRPGVG